MNSRFSRYVPPGTTISQNAVGGTYGNGMYTNTAGVYGMTGSTGSTGPTGVRGACGATGVQGSTGVQGAQGMRGRARAVYNNAANSARTMNVFDNTAKRRPGAMYNNAAAFR